MVQIKKNTWEIDEFDCASIFLLIGTEKAMVIDCGMGIGDLRGAIEMITDKPLICVISHGHIDHTANARQFGEIWLNPKDQGIEIPMNYARRRYDTEHIAQRQKGSIGAPYNMYRLYAYDIEVDLREPGPDEPMPVIHDLTDGMQFDLGGRTVTAYTLIPSGAVVSVSNYAYGGDSTLLIFRDSAEPVESDLSGRAVWLSAAGNKVAALLSSSVVSTDLTTGRQEAACNVPADTKSIAMADESTVYLLGVREIRKENLKVIEADNTLSQTE